MDLRTHRDVSNGFGDGLSQAFELVLTPAIFGGIGWLLDRWLGTAPVFMFVLGIGVFLYECWRIVYAYIETMDRQQADKPWTRTPTGGNRG